MPAKELLTTMTKRGQITVPVEIQRLLGLKPHDKVALAIEDGTVRLKPARFTLDAVLGSVEPATKTEDFKAISREAREEQAEPTVRDVERA